ncbi:hypothetical protein [Fuscibacter oryzae]|uniref:PEP-CTERM sorting domain-containing protein n=1 Tax=Fuscibacter oryzae TaxID=2803939 RepID=A0A8J7ST33_9RHOB|nr:hypothetical protein [Fuscibacter oryzae]MBL4928836.1 hypothetical protein [Fuscibacter oryzae]
MKILAVAAAMALVGLAQAKAAVVDVVYASGPLAVQKSCLTYYLEDTCQGPAMAGPFAMQWALHVAVETAELTFLNGSAHVEWDGVAPKIAEPGIYRWTGTDWAAEAATPGYGFALLLLGFDLSDTGVASNWQISSEVYQDFGTWYLDAWGGTATATLWQHEDGDLAVMARYAAEGIAPVPLPASAPLLGGALMLMAAYRRSRARG